MRARSGDRNEDQGYEYSLITIFISNAQTIRFVSKTMKDTMLSKGEALAKPREFDGTKQSKTKSWVQHAQDNIVKLNVRSSKKP